jgi:hypothetical protein
MTIKSITPEVTPGQKKQIVRFVIDASEKAVETTIAQGTIDKDGAQLVIERGDELKAALEQAIVDILRRLGSRYPVLTETRLLKPVRTAAVPVKDKPFDASEFFRNRPGLYVWDSFLERFDLGVRSVESAPERLYVASLLKEDAYDRDIRRELPENHLSTLEDVAGFIKAQPDGKEGFLLNNGYANIFYVEGKNGEVFVVSVSWSSGSREWDVLDWSLGGDGDWSSDNYVVCPGNAAL